MKVYNSDYSESKIIIFLKYNWYILSIIRFVWY